MTYTLLDCYSATFTAFFGGFLVGMLGFWLSYFAKLLLGFRSVFRKNPDIAF